MQQHYRLVGGLGSPYSMKMRAIFRYRRLPHVFEMRNGRVRAEVADVRPQIIPMVRFPGEAHWHVDSTPLIYALEARHSERSVLPSNAGDRFLAELIEDFADEWLTKAMFHYRWYYATDRDFSAYWIATDQVTADEDHRLARREFADRICERQVGRMALVGCTEQNKPVIEHTYERVLDALEPHVGFGRFLFGTRPSLADFGLFGQLKTLGDDSSPQWLMRHRAPTVCHWVRQADDLSGIEGEWRTGETGWPEVVEALVALCGEAYLPFLGANAKALESGEDSVALSIWDRPFVQPPFRYQAKCYSRLRGLYAGLDAEDQDRLGSLLEPSGCLRWLQ